MSHIPEDAKVAKLLFAAIAEFEREFPNAPKPEPHSHGEFVGWRSKVLDFDVFFFPKRVAPKTRGSSRGSAARSTMSLHDSDVLVAIEISSSSDKTTKDTKAIHKVFGVAGKDDPDQLVKLFTMIRIFAEESSPWH